MVIFFYGEDSFRSSEKMKQIRDKFLGSAVQADLSVLDFSEKSNLEIGEGIFTQSLFSDKKMIIFKNLISDGPKESQEKLEKILKKHQSISEDKKTTLLFWEKNSPKKNSKFFKFLLSLKNIKKQEFKKLKGVFLEKWIVERILKIDSKASISKEALSELILFTGEDMFMISNEIEKLVNFSSRKEITKNTVSNLVKASLTSNIFNTIDALGRNDKKTALDLLLTHFENGDDPFYVLSMFCFQFRNMILVADANEKGLSEEFNIAKETGLHPYVVKKSLNSLRFFSLEKLKNIYANLTQMDVKVKTGKIDIKLALQKFIVDL